MHLNLSGRSPTRQDDLPCRHCGHASLRCIIAVLVGTVNCEAKKASACATIEGRLARMDTSCFDECVRVCVFFLCGQIVSMQMGCRGVRWRGQMSKVLGVC